MTYQHFITSSPVSVTETILMCVSQNSHIAVSINRQSSRVFVKRHPVENL